MKEVDSGGPPIDRKEIESKLKRWIQVHRPLLNLTLTNALTLQITPDRCKTDVLFLVLNANISSNKPAQFFTVEKTEVSSLSETRQLVVQKLGPEQDVLFTQFLAQSKDIRDKGGVGIALMMIMVPQAGIVHMTPFGMPDLLTEADVRLNKDWEANLKVMVERGVAI